MILWHEHHTRTTRTTLTHHIHSLNSKETIETRIHLQSKLLSLSHSYWLSHTLNALVALKVPDIIASHTTAGRLLLHVQVRVWGKKSLLFATNTHVVSSSTVASTLQLHAPSLYRAMRLMASQGIFNEVSHDQFQLTPLGHYLRSDAQGIVRAEREKEERERGRERRSPAVLCAWVSVWVIHYQDLFLELYAIEALESTIPSLLT